MRFTLLAASLFAAGDVFAQRSPVAAAINGGAGGYVVDGRYRFNQRQFWDFSKINVGGSTNLPAGQRVPTGLKASDFPVDSYVYTPANVIIARGYLHLKVNANTFISGEVTTNFKISYASVRTVAMLSEPAGVCNGMFFYQSDTQETDIEFLSNRNSASNTDAASDAGAPAGTRYLWLSNQAASKRKQKTTKPVPLPANPTSSLHEYRLDLVPGMTRFFIDGKQVWNSTDNVPTVAGVWVFNNWADGDPAWSAGPPKQDAYFRIRSIDMYYS
ncbi:glycoside hydrolase family 16 protein [Colletotrichum sojae]|uniref:Glycoside hydrolase family 16 protein n=1 Tax=Colletotrichum sojae TaxID=2175907 RepID=A0A8H6ILL2_9PEZI|nr:glycoside hydrolase family 16 protein [Colletotrichum sojae]